MNKILEHNQTDISELEKLAHIYKELSEPKRNIFVMSGNLLLASQNAEKSQETKKTHRTARQRVRK